MSYRVHLVLVCPWYTLYGLKSIFALIQHMRNSNQKKREQQQSLNQTAIWYPNTSLTLAWTPLTRPATSLHCTWLPTKSCKSRLATFAWGEDTEASARCRVLGWKRSVNVNCTGGDEFMCYGGSNWYVSWSSFSDTACFVCKENRDWWRAMEAEYLCTCTV